MFRHGRYSLDKRPGGRLVKRSVYNVLSVLSLHCANCAETRRVCTRLGTLVNSGLGGVQLLGHLQSDVYHVCIGTRRRLPAGAIRKSPSRGIFVPIVLVNASRERPTVTCRTLSGCGRLTSIFLSMPHYPPSLFFLASKAVIIVFYFGS